MTEIAPIRPDVVAEVDPLREMLDSAHSMLNNYFIDNGHAPHTICIALLGHPLDASQGSTMMTYCPTDTNTARLQAASAAALLFTRHAIKD